MTAAGCPKSSTSAARRRITPGITQVSLEVTGRALRGALEQRLCVQGSLSRRRTPGPRLTGAGCGFWRGRAGR
jgi:hypothetical protein